MALAILSLIGAFLGAIPAILNVLEGRKAVRYEQDKIKARQDSHLLDTVLKPPQ
jgi:hypothetical protein